MKHTIAVVLFFGLFTGCEARRQTEQTTFEAPEAEYVLAIAVDFSGSFIDKMANDGEAYRFTMDVIDRYMRERPSDEGRLVITQLSATDDPLLWEGPPMQLRKDFASADDFRNFVLARNDPNGSRIFEGLSSTLSYLDGHRAIRNGAKPALFVLSDMADTSDDADEQEAEISLKFKEFGQSGGTVGMYYVHQQLLPRWQQTLAKSGMRDYVVECDIVTRPTLPEFQ
ncbi:hypothetical protein [Rhodopirellula sallentina]|uniref:VWFA domain-containing protein n=1 Tax=Rhodopirellula sallentina SM41 TaxID=1263870 RepID=M5U0Y4_9BACT|nr:hypothetical protein [Rhodopirellula sallentina]EMI55105.1 hypothetical protein RSSM_03429 [Rhodopirellula sallentina SM41]